MTAEENSTQQTTCTRCGTCCQKGGPAFHIQDKELLSEGKISMADIYTIRRGEPVYDNVSDDLIAAETDIIKIRGNNTSWSCRFLTEDSSCQIYDIRPSECRLMKCWDTAEIEAMYSKDRLTREDLIKNIEGLWGFIEEHQIECSYDAIRQLVTAGKGKLEGKSLDHILDMIKYDLAIRPIMVEKSQIKEEWIEFLLGRPIIETISLFDLQVIKDGDSYRIEKIEKANDSKSK